MQSELLEIKVALNINAQRILSQYQLHSTELERQVEEGIRLAIEELSGDKFIESVKQQTLTVFNNIIRDQVWYHYDAKKQLQKLIEEKLQKKFDAYAEQIVDKISGNLDAIFPELKNQ